MLVEIRHIDESYNIFDCNRSEGTLFARVESAKRKFVPMTLEQERTFRDRNKFVGYEGKEVKLFSWAIKTSKCLERIYLSGETVEEKRQNLWQSVIDNKVPRSIKAMIREVTLGNNVTVWYLSQYDIPVAKLIARFILWYVENQ